MGNLGLAVAVFYAMSILGVNAQQISALLCLVGV